MCVAPDRRREFTSADKQASRLFNVAGLAGSLHIADPGECLWLDWLELAGKNNPTVDLLAPMLKPDAGRFIGVDNDQGAIDSNAVRDLLHTQWLFARTTLQDLLADQPELFERVGVLNYDSFSGWNGERIIAETTPIVRFAAQQVRRVGEFMLIVNAELTRNVPLPDAMIRVQRLFAPLLAPRQRVVEEADCFIYKAAGGKNHMLNVRVKLGFR